MRKFIGLTKRNLLVFFKDKQTVVFSLLTSIIVLVLYLLFLKGSFVNAIESVLAEIDILKPLVKHEDIASYSNLILLTGILGSAMITVPFNCLTTIVKDKENKVDFDILATPIHRSQIILSYFTAAVCSSVLLTSIILTAGLVILNSIGSFGMTAVEVAKAYGVVALGSISATAIFMIMILFFKSSSASGAFFGMLSAASGFVIGAYIPLSQFSEKVQTVCNLFPASHITIVLRNVLLQGVLRSMDESIGGLDEGMFTSTLRDIFGFKAYMFGNGLEVSQMIMYVIAFLAVSIVGMVFIYSKTYKRR